MRVSTTSRLSDPPQPIGSGWEPAAAIRTTVAASTSKIAEVSAARLTWENAAAAYEEVAPHGPRPSRSSSTARRRGIHQAPEAPDTPGVPDSNAPDQIAIAGQREAFRSWSERTIAAGLTRDRLLAAYSRI